MTQQLSRRSVLQATAATMGSADSLPFKRTPQGLEVRLPEGLAGSPAVALKVSGGGLA
jgi:alpha-L-fucosidase